MSVIIKSWNGNFLQTRMEQLCRQILLPALPGRSIEVYVPHGSLAPQNTDETKFVVNVWSMPDIQGMPAVAPPWSTLTKPTKLWGCRISCPDWITGSHFPPAAGFGYRYIRDGDVPAAVCGMNDLYIAFDAVHHDTDDSEEILRRIFTEAAELLRNELKSKPRTKRDDAGAYAEMCNARRVATIDELQEQLRTYQSEIDSLRKKLHEAYVKVDLKVRELAVANSIPGVDKTQASREWRGLIGSPLVTEAHCLGNVITVHTKLILVQHPQTERFHRIGKFRITVQQGATRHEGVRIVNLTQQIDGMQHPHVFASGICYGTANAAVDELAQRKEYVALLHLIITFLQGAIIDYGHQQLNNWPLATPEEIAVWEKERKPKGKKTKPQKTKAAVVAA